MKKIAIFDLDGTLIDSVSSIAYACNQALIQNNLQPRTIEEYKHFAGDGALELVKRAVYASGDINCEKLDKVYNTYNDIFSKDCTKHITIFDDVNELLNQLKQKNVKLAILSNKPHERTLDVVHKFFGAGIFDFVLGYKTEQTKKPSPYGALLIANHFNIQPEDCVYIGDTDTDMKTGVAAGMFTIGVTWGFRIKQELIDNNADDIVEKPLQLLKYFD